MNTSNFARLKELFRRAAAGQELTIGFLGGSITQGLIYYCYGGYQLMSSVTKKVTPYFKINYAFIDVAAPIGMILMAIQYIVYTYRHLKGLGNPGDDQKALLKVEEE